jgi:hypothetical protein
MISVDVFYQGEHIREIEHIEIDDGHSLGAVKALILEKHGGDTAMLLFLEDGDEPLDETAQISTVGCAAGFKLHVHRCHHVEVAVTFAGETVHHSFRPGATVARIKRWAAERKFGMTEEEASEHRLQITGTDERPAPGTHIGTLATWHACRVSFDLVPDERVNGAFDLGKIG